MSRDTLTIKDNRTGEKYEIEIGHGTIPSIELRKIKVSEDDFGLMAYDPGFKNTASCKSRITFIDGEKGILRYRGYPIEQLAEYCSFLEVAYLLFNGELPSQNQLEEWENQVNRHRIIPEGIADLIRNFRYDGHPMGMLMSAVAGMSSYFPEAADLDDLDVRHEQVYRLIGAMPTLAAFIHRHRCSLPAVYPDADLSYPGNFLSMVFKMDEPRYEVNPVLEKALDILFILHADHEQNCSTNSIRSVGSSRPDPYCATAAAIAALSGPLHGGANEAVLRMLAEIGSIDQIPAYIERVKNGEFRLMGFGHRVYKNYDPRAKIIKELAHQVFKETRSNPLLDVALKLEEIALEDSYFVDRKLYPNVDFYSGLIYQAMGFPTEIFPVLFAVARTSGWLSQWEEMLNDPEQKIARPRQIYLGEQARDLPDWKREACRAK
ncbi:MAG TPA: citrate synthase [Acidobacteriota bacterium]|nr:citrate synthase [Acidobacteriota bacterium]